MARFRVTRIPSHARGWITHPPFGDGTRGQKQACSLFWARLVPSAIPSDPHPGISVGGLVRLVLLVVFLAATPRSFGDVRIHPDPEIALEHCLGSYQTWLSEGNDVSDGCLLHSCYGGENCPEGGGWTFYLGDEYWGSYYGWYAFDRYSWNCANPAPPLGTVWNEIEDCAVPLAQRVNPNKEMGCSGDPNRSAGNPCDAATGEKYEVARDYAGGDGVPSLSRHYNSAETQDVGLGVGWTSNLHKRLEIAGTGTEMIVRRADGRGEPATTSGGGAWQFDPDSKLDIVQDISGYTVSRRDGGIEQYDIGGRLSYETDAAGRATTYGYDAGGRLDSVTGPYGHTLTFSYHPDGHLATVTDPAHGTIRYTYDASGNLAQVTYQDDSYVTYHYEDPSLPNHLTGITDEKNDRFATFSYDAKGRAVSTAHADIGNGPQEYFGLAYDSYTQTTVTDAKGTAEILTFEGHLGVKNLLSRTIQADGKGIVQSFDANNNMISRTDAEGRTTTYTYNAFNQRASVTEASGTAEARTTTYEYLSPAVDLPTHTRSPSVLAGQQKEVEVMYENNLPMTIVRRGFMPDGTPIARTTDFDYNASGRVIRIDGPRTDVDDVTTFDYYDCATGAECGQLAYVDNALGQRVTYDAYDENGRVTQMTDANGLVTRYQYDSRGRLRFLTETPPEGAGRVTQYVYDSAGQLEQTILPEGTTLIYSYDAAHYLRSITDGVGNSIEYRYDVNGNRTTEETRDPLGTLTRTVTTQYDIRDRVDAMNAGGSITDLVFDAVGNLVGETDPNLNPSTEHQYDALDRLTLTIDALANTTDYDYDANDQLTRVVAPNNATTTYAYDDLGNLLQEVSPDRGVLLYSHDATGNTTSITDARGVAATYSYDALDRVVGVDYPGTEEDISYSYDNCTNGVGRLCAVTDQSGTTAYAYDAFGNITAHQGVGYFYGTANRVQAITYPSGAVVSYGYDAAGQVESVTLDDGASVRTLASGITYRPFGPMQSLTYGFGGELTQTYDAQYRMTSQTLPGVYEVTYPDYDANGNLRNRLDVLEAAESTFTYDALDRLDTAVGPFGTRDYGLDPNGNRLVLTADGTDTTYAYAPASNRLQSETGWAYTRDASGNRTAKLDTGGEGYLYAYNQQNRLATVTERRAVQTGKGRSKPRELRDTLLATYFYNALGQRVAKTTAGGTTQYVYGLNGELLAEIGGGEIEREYVWLHGQPLALLDFTTTTIPGADQEQIVDNDAAGTISTGAWTLDSAKKAKSYGTDYRQAAGGTGSTYRWTPALTAGTWEVYAWWSNDRKNATSVPYTVIHARGSTGLTVDQSRNGGEWVLLGAFEFAGDGTGYVEVDDSGGQTVADAVRFFRSGEPQTQMQLNVYYVHNDHLGTPKKLSNETGQVVWRAVYDPFGTAVVDSDPDADGRSIRFNFRFPGQYYDLQASLNYNYFRYYDFKTGSYLRSDPSGLSGGLATFLYAASSPIVLTDKLGLDTAGCDLGPFKRFETPCRLECCAVHDECYRNYNCSARSWWDPTSACGQCNAAVIRCFLDCQVDPYKDDPTRPNYYCAKEGNYITIPSCKYPDRRTAERKCRT